MATGCYLGIDAGTQGLSVVLTDENMNVLGTGDGHYAMSDGLDDGCYEQHPNDWIAALITAMADLRTRVRDFEVAAIGISGQMHGEVLVGENDQPLKSARLWCDARNEAQGARLTKSFGVKIPKRLTAARWLWTIENQPTIAAQTKHITTPGGWIGFQLTRQWKLGAGDASGMFPIDGQTLDYDQQLLAKFDALVQETSSINLPDLMELLPEVTLAGQDAGTLTEAMAAKLHLSPGIPVAGVEGDQPAALAGSLIGESGMVSVSFGTSVCANSVGDRGFEGVSNRVDHFCAPDGKPINMVFLRNGTTYMNTLVEMFSAAVGGDRDSAFATIMPQVIGAAADCGGVLAMPFIDDEPGLGVERGHQAGLFGLSASNATPGNIVKSALLATMFNLKWGSEVLDQQNFPRTELVLSGGLTRTPELGQILADVFGTPVKLLAGADEGCGWGAALLAKFRELKMAASDLIWSEFLRQQISSPAKTFTPDARQQAIYQQSYHQYRRLFESWNSMSASLVEMQK